VSILQKFFGTKQGKSKVYPTDVSCLGALAASSKSCIQMLSNAPIPTTSYGSTQGKESSTLFNCIIMSIGQFDKPYLFHEHLI
jgi:hypothetical protein